MFFVLGLTSGGKDVLVNPDQVLYVCPKRFLSKKTALILTHNKCLIVDQDIQTVHQRFEDYLKNIGDSGDDDARGVVLCTR